MWASKSHSLQMAGPGFSTKVKLVFLSFPTTKLLLGFFIHSHRHTYTHTHTLICIAFSLSVEQISHLALKKSISTIIRWHSGLIKKNCLGIPWWSSGWESACQCRGHRFNPWSGKIPHATEQQSLWATITEACLPRVCAPQQEKPRQWEARTLLQALTPTQQLEKVLAAIEIQCSQK